MLKKGMMGLCCAVLAGMSLLPAPTPAQSSHYLCDFPESNPLRYQDFRWLPNELPIKVYLPPVPYASSNPGMYIPLVQRAFNSWTEVAPALRFSFVDDPKQARIRVIWHEHFPENEGQWGWAYFPLPVYNRQREVTGHSSQLNLAIKAQPGTGMGIGAILFSYDELLAITTHEVGHALGLPHSGNEDDLMSPYIFKFSADSKWGISQRDVNTLYALYGLPKKLKVHPCS